MATLPSVVFSRRVIRPVRLAEQVRWSLSDVRDKLIVKGKSGMFVRFIIAFDHKSCILDNNLIACHILFFFFFSSFTMRCG